MIKNFLILILLLGTLMFVAGSAIAANWDGQMLYNDPTPIGPSLGPYDFDIDMIGGVITYGVNFLQFDSNYEGFVGSKDDYIGYSWIDSASTVEVTIWDIQEDLNEGAGTLSGYVSCGPSLVPEVYADYYFTANAVPIPSAVWLLGSTFIGLVGFRSKVRKR